MEAPKRIVDDPAFDSLARELIEDARRETAGSGAKGRALAALGAIGATTAATSTSSALASLKVLGIGVLTVGVLAGGAVLATRSDAPAPSTTPSAPTAPSSAIVSASASPPKDETVPSDPPPVISATRVVAKAPARSAEVKVTTITPSPSTSSATSRLAEEARSLETARRELGATRAQAALAELDRYERDFPLGELRPEAMALRVEALAAAGNEAAAKALGRQFLARHAGHPAAARVRRAMGDTNF